MSFADPLWEFVLDDYEDENVSLFSKFSRKKNKKPNYDDKSSVGSRSFLSSKREKRTDYRDDTEDRDNFWDVISGKPPVATRMRRSRSFSGRSKTRMSTKKEKTRSSSLTRSQSSVSEASNEKRKRMFSTKRFSWNPNQRSSQGASMREYAAPNASSVKHTSLTDDRDDKTSDEGSEDGFDPMDLLFQIADTLDPWGLDSEGSYSDDDASYTDDEGDRNSHATSNVESESNMSDVNRLKPMGRSSKNKRTRKLDSLLDQKPNPSKYDSRRKAQSKKKENDATEIRLRVNPGGNTLSEEVFKNTTTGYVEHEDEIIRVPSDEERHNLFATSFDSDTFQTTLKIAGEANPPVSEPRETREMRENREAFMNERRRPEIEEMRAPTSPRRAERSQPVFRDDISKDSGSAKTSTGLKKTLCGLKKVDKADTTSARSRRSERREAFPSSRMIIDGESHKVTEYDPAGGVMGPMAESKGPQPVLNYDYESNMNMDVIYVKPNHKPRTSLSVRKLGTPPPISSVLGADNIVIQVEASLVSETDCIIRQGLWWGKSRPSYPSTPGIDVVGKVYCTKQQTERVYGLKAMQTVMSLVKWGGNARFMTIHPKQLVKVPEGLDPADVACLPECYLSAFQVLHMGQTGAKRYNATSLKGKSILILGCMTNNMGKAMIELAFQAGVKTVYATAKKKHWKTLISYGVMPLSTNPMQYIQRIAGTIDLVLAPNGNLREDVSPVHFRALVPKYGQLIISGHRIVGNDIPLDDWKRSHQTPTLSCGKNKALQKILRNSVSYDVYEEWEKNLDLCKKDLTHLLTLLESKSIRPEVLDRIPLNKVAKAHELLETKRLPGFLVCEPWIKGKKRALYL